MTVDPIMSMGYGPNSDVGTISRQGYIGVAVIIEEIVRRAAKYAPIEFELIVKRMIVQYTIKSNIVREETFSTDLRGNTLGKEMAVFAKVVGGVFVNSQFVITLKSNISVPLEVSRKIYGNVVVPGIKKFGMFANTLINSVVELPVRGIKEMRRFLEEIILDDEDEGSNT